MLTYQFEVAHNSQPFAFLNTFKLSHLEMETPEATKDTKETADAQTYTEEDEKAPLHDLDDWGQIIAIAVAYIAVIALCLFGNSIYFTSTDTILMAQQDIIEWDFIGTNSPAMVDTYIRKVPGTKLFAFKGAVVLDHHIVEVLNTYANVHTTTDWVDLLKIMETLPVALVDEASNRERKGEENKNFMRGWLGKLKRFTTAPAKNTADRIGNNILAENPFQPTLSDVVYQYYQLPWPVAARDFLFRRTLRLYPKERSVTAQYVSVIDPRRPPVNLTSSSSSVPMQGRAISQSTIRAESPFTNWLFQDFDAYCADMRTYGDKGASAASTSTNDRDGDRTSSNPHRNSYFHDGKAHTVALCREAEVDTSAASSAACKTGAGGRRRGGGRRTYVEIEALVDNKGSLPAWFVNHVQR